MPRMPGRKAVPWLLLLEAAQVMRHHWGHLDVNDRRELSRIVRKSQLRPANLSKHERSELVRIVRRLDLITAGRKLMPLHGGLRKSQRR